ncbi:hypothetical protein BDV18DRAFT_140803 [Aspergillus unguis]
MAGRSITALLALGLVASSAAQQLEARYWIDECTSANGETFPCTNYGETAKRRDLPTSSPLSTPVHTSGHPVVPIVSTSPTPDGSDVPPAYTTTF